MMLRTVRMVCLGALACLALAAGAATAFAGEARLIKHPDYHQGKIVFSYMGDLWLVDEATLQPKRLTVHPGRDVHPRFSPDGKYIAFTSTRFGNPDVFVIPASGGKATRLTYHSAADTVVGWSRDSKKVIFNSARGEPYPMGIPRLYEVPAEGGLEAPLPTDWGYWGSYSPDGGKLAFNRHPMSWWRRHYRGSYAADLWILDLQEKKYTRIVDDKTPDPEKANALWPMYGSDGFIYFVSDRDVKAKAGSDEVLKSTNNIWKVRANGNGAEPPVQVTFHKSGALFFPSMSADGKTIVYEENFGLWKLDVPTGKAKEIKIEITSDDAENNYEVITYNSEADGFSLSPSGKRAAISIHGELFTIATGKGETRRVTGTPHVRESAPQWSPDGKYIAFLANADGVEHIYLCDEDGKNLKKLTRGETEKGTFVWSPDGKSILYTTGDNRLVRLDLDGKEKVIAGADGLSQISDPQWSPDGKWVSFIKTGKNYLPHVYVTPADGGPERRITDDTSYMERLARWTPDGKHLIYLGGGDLLAVSSVTGGGRRSTGQLYAVPLQQTKEEPPDQSIDSEKEAQQAEKEKKKDLLSKFKEKGSAGKEAKVEVKIDFDRIARRGRRLTTLPDAIGSVTVTPDGSAVVFTTGGVEGGSPVQSIWSVSVKGGTPTRVAQVSTPTPGEGEGGPRRFGGFGGGLSSLQFSRDGRTLYYKQGKSIYATTYGGAAATAGTSGEGTRTGTKGAGRFDGATGSAPAAAGSAGRKLTFTARVEVDHREQRKQVFQEAWFVMQHRFYDEAMHGVDWKRIRKVYEPLLEHCASTEDLHDVVNMMLGELNASHTGISGGGGGRRGQREGGAPQPRHPGFELEPDYQSGYYRIAHIYKNGPADKPYLDLRVGDYVLSVDGAELKAGQNYWKLYADLTGSRWEFTVNAKPEHEGARLVRVEPISSMALTNLQYEKWVEERRSAVEKLSKGRIGYLHIRQMNEASLRQFERDLAALADKEALVIDQRFNPGGNIDQELLQILQQKKYQINKFRGTKLERPRPMRGFFGPMVVLANERSTSDAEVFPDGFRTLKLGKIVGVTTYGAVIGTGSYQLMDGSSIRTPGMGLWNVNGTNLENYGVPPDIYVENRPEDYFAGRDPQLERAVQELQRELKGRNTNSGATGR